MNKLIPLILILLSGCGKIQNTWSGDSIQYVVGVKVVIIHGQFQGCTGEIDGNCITLKDQSTCQVTLIDCSWIYGTIVLNTSDFTSLK